MTQTPFFATNKITDIMKKILLHTIVFFVAFATLKSQYVMPSGGEDGYDWRVGSTQVITWSKYFMDTTRTIDILLWNADSVSFTTIATNIPINEEYYLWDIPMTQPTGNKFKVKIVYHNGFLPQFKYMSNDFFSIKEPLHSTPPVASPPITKNKANNIKIYPNPTSNTLYIESANKFFGIELYDVNGSLVLSKRFDYTNIYPLESIGNKLASGSYTILVRFMGNYVTEHLSISK